jgi:hypothetical protein
VTVEQAASTQNATVMSAHTAEKIIGIVTALAADQPAAVAIALAVVSDALSVRLRHPRTDWTAVADLIRRLVGPGISVVLGAARPHTASGGPSLGPGSQPRALARCGPIFPSSASGLLPGRHLQCSHRSGWQPRGFSEAGSQRLRLSLPRARWKTGHSQ